MNLKKLHSLEELEYVDKGFITFMCQVVIQ